MNRKITPGWTSYLMIIMIPCVPILLLSLVLFKNYSNKSLILFLISLFVPIFWIIWLKQYSIEISGNNLIYKEPIFKKYQISLIGAKTEKRNLFVSNSDKKNINPTAIFVEAENGTVIKINAKLFKEKNITDLLLSIKKLSISEG